MSNQTVIHFCRIRRRAAESLGGEFEAWQKDHADAMAARDLEDWIKEAIKLGEMTLELHSLAWNLLRANRLTDPQAVGECVLNLLDTTIHAFGSMQTGLEVVRSTGYTIENEGAFHEEMSGLV